MHNLNKLHIHQLARKNILGIHTITQQTTGFADIHNQMQQAALSVVSNIAEGAGMNTNKQFLRFLTYARGSNTELKSQLQVMVNLGKISSEHHILDQDGSSGSDVYAVDATTTATGDLKSPVFLYHWLCHRKSTVACRNFFHTYPLQTITVGMALAGHPPYRSGRAGLPHPAPAFDQTRKR